METNEVEIKDNYILFDEFYLDVEGWNSDKLCIQIAGNKEKSEYIVNIDVDTNIGIFKDEKECMIGIINYFAKDAEEEYKIIRQVCEAVKRY